MKEIRNFVNSNFDAFEIPVTIPVRETPIAPGAQVLSFDGRASPDKADADPAREEVAGAERMGTAY